MVSQEVLPESGHTTERRWSRHKIDVPAQVVAHGPTNVVIIQGLGSELNCGGMSQTEAQPTDFFLALTFAHRAFCAAAIRLRPAAEILRFLPVAAAFGLLPCM